MLTYEERYDITGLLLTAEVISETICDSAPGSFLDTNSSPSDF